jgi:hypothetical protein
MHDAPWLKITNQELIIRFLDRCRIDRNSDRSILLRSVSEAFSHIPYENLTKILKTGSVISAHSAMRYPDEVIGDWLRWGTGGTCFSLTAAIIAMFNALGIDAHPLLADRHYGPDTHCGLVLVDGSDLLLLDPGYLLFIPTVLPRETATRSTTGYNVIELVPLQGGERLELYTVVKGNRKLRLTYKSHPVDPLMFARAWEQSFTWEMMTYPVLTGTFGGVHHYIQGTNLSVRNGIRTDRKVLSIDNEIEFITGTMGIHRDIVTKAFEALSSWHTPVNLHR